MCEPYGSDPGLICEELGCVQLLTGRSCEHRLEGEGQEFVTCCRRPVKLTVERVQLVRWIGCLTDDDSIRPIDGDRFNRHRVLIRPEQPTDQ
jgi:hypothetical protein